MFSNLRPENTVYVLEQSDKLYLKIGKVIENKPNYTGSIDMKIKVDDHDYELKQLPYNQTIASSGSIIISENLNQILEEVRKLKSKCEKEISNFDYYTQTAKDCNFILRQNDSSYDKEQKRDEEITSLKKENEMLKEQVQSMSKSLSNIEKLLSDKNSK